jgi:hypothetical protein
MFLLPGGATSPSPYVTASVRFDGANDYLGIASFTGQADTKIGIISYWANHKGGNGSTFELISPVGDGEDVRRGSDNKVYFDGYPSPDFTGNTAMTDATGWHHILMSWDSVAGRVQLYVDNVDDINTSSSSNADTKWTPTSWVFFANSGFAMKYNADIADFYFNIDDNLDISVAANRLKFISGGKPVSLGDDGSLPTGEAPMVFLKADAATPANFANNLGSGGGTLSITGSLTNGESSPTD